MKFNFFVSASLLLATLSCAQAAEFGADALLTRSQAAETGFAHHIAARAGRRDVDHLESSSTFKKRAHGSKRAKKCSSSGKSKGKSSTSSSNSNSNVADTVSKVAKTDSSGSESSSKTSTSSKSQSSGSSSNDDESNTSSSSGGIGKGLIGLLKFAGSSCVPDASEEFPNGNINFLNCGLHKSGSGSWNPPDVKLHQIKVLDASAAAASSTFSACKKYKGAFEHASQQTGVPATFLMAFAMQESTCNQGVTGANGEIGLMQLTPGTAKHVGVNNPYDVYQNALGGAKYFKETLDQNDNNVLLAVGQYNGWQKGMTYQQATNRGSPCAQNNLDYLNEFFNGWLQGKVGYSMTKVFNNMKSCNQ